MSSRRNEGDIFLSGGHSPDHVGMSLSVVVLVEDEQMVSPEDLSYAEQAFLSQGSAGFGYPSIVTGDLSRDGETLRSVTIPENLRKLLSSAEQKKKLF